MGFGEQRETDSGKHAEFDDVPGDCFVIDVLHRPAERRPPWISSDQPGHHIASVVPGGAFRAANGTVDECHDSAPAAVSTSGVTDHAQST